MDNVCYIVCQNTKAHLDKIDSDIKLISGIYPNTQNVDTSQYTEYEIRVSSQSIDASERIENKSFLHFLVAKDFEEYDNIDSFVSLYYIEDKILNHKPIPENIRQNILLREGREYLKNQALEYSKSPQVDGCIIQGKTIVFNGSLRGKISNRLQDEKATGNTDVTLYFDGQQYTNKIDIFEGMLLKINRRADMNFDNLQKHIGKINTLDMEQLKTYDYKTGYEAPLTLM